MNANANIDNDIMQEKSIELYVYVDYWVGRGGWEMSVHYVCSPAMTLGNGNNFLVWPASHTTANDGRVK